MSSPIPLVLAVEDLLQEEILRRMLQQIERPFFPGPCYMRGGFGYLKKKVAGFNEAAKGTPFLVLTDLDLDKGPCASDLMASWLAGPRHPNLIFRVAVHAVESWILADRVAFSRFLGVGADLIPSHLDEVDRPRKLLLELARRSRRRALREAIVPRPTSTAPFGPGYNGVLAEFLRSSWRLAEARSHSHSLDRAARALENFEPAPAD